MAEAIATPAPEAGDLAAGPDLGDLLPGELRLANFLLAGGEAGAALCKDLMDLVLIRKERDALRIQQLGTIPAIRTIAGSWYPLTAAGQLFAGDLLHLHIDGASVHLTVDRVQDLGGDDELLFFREKDREPLYTANLLLHRDPSRPLRFLCRTSTRLIPV